MKKPGLLGSSGLLLLLVLLLWPLGATHASIHLRVLGMAFFYATLALSWNIFALTGCMSLGHAAFFGLGAYASALANHYWHLSPYVSIVLGGLAGGAYSLLWCLVFKKLHGARFALATLASVEIPKVIIDNWDSFTFGSLGLAGIGSLPDIEFLQISVPLGENLKAQYFLLLSFMLLAASIHRKAIVSRWGWAIRSVREDETAAANLGVNVLRIRFQALILSASLTGLCGALYAHLIGLIEPALVFNLHISALPLVLSIFGGRYQFYGPILGALLLYPLDQILFHSWLPVGHGALYGIVIILTLLFFPHGIGTWIQQRTESASN